MKHQEVRTLSVCPPISSRSERLLKLFQTFSIYTQTIATYDDTKKETNNRAKGTPLG